MYKVTTKNGSIMFVRLDDALHWIDSQSGKILVKTAFVKIRFMEDDEN